MRINGQLTGKNKIKLKDLGCWLLVKAGLRALFGLSGVQHRVVMHTVLPLRDKGKINREKL